MKVHLKTRDGWVKTIDQGGPNPTPHLSIPRRSHESRAYGLATSGMRLEQNFETPIYRQDFNLVMEAQLRDHRTNVVTTEAWYEEA